MFAYFTKRHNLLVSSNLLSEGDLLLEGDENLNFIYYLTNKIFVQLLLELYENVQLAI